MYTILICSHESFAWLQWSPLILFPGKLSGIWSLPVSAVQVPQRELLWRAFPCAQPAISEHGSPQSTWLCQPVVGHKAVPHLLQMTLWTTQITIIAFISLERVQIGIYLKLYIKLLSGASFAVSPEETTALQTSFWACSCKLSCFLLFPRNPDFLYPPSNGSVIFGDIEFICYCNSRNIVSHCRKAPFAHLFVNFSVCRWLKSSILFAEKSKRKLLTTHYFNIKYPNFLNNA